MQPGEITVPLVRITFEAETLDDLYDALADYLDHTTRYIRPALPADAERASPPDGSDVQLLAAVPDPNVQSVHQPLDPLMLPPPSNPSTAVAAATGVALPGAGAAPPPPTVAPTADAACSQLGGDLDSAGYPHNPEYDSKNRAQLADGTWRLKRNCDKVARTAWQRVYRETYPLDLDTPRQNTLPATFPGPLGTAIASGAVTPQQPATPDASAPVNRCLSLATALYENRNQADFDKIGAAVMNVCAGQGLESTNDLVRKPECAPTFFEGLLQVARQYGIQDSNECRPL